MSGFKLLFSVQILPFCNIASNLCGAFFTFVSACFKSLDAALMYPNLFKYDNLTVTDQVQTYPHIEHLFVLHDKR